MPAQRSSLQHHPVLMLVMAGLLSEGDLDITILP
jgi:hypothetical protein